MFLNRGPQWTVEKLASYWIDKIAMRPPTNDDSHYQEIEWVLDVRLDALRTPKDMELYRQSQIFEKILTMSTSPHLPMNCYEKVVDLLFRCTYVEGSTTLITRCGIMGWLKIHARKQNGRMRSNLLLLGRRLYEFSDQTRVNEWSRESLSAALARLDSLHPSISD